MGVEVSSRVMTGHMRLPVGRTHSYRLPDDFKHTSKMLPSRKVCAANLERGSYVNGIEYQDVPRTANCT